MERERSQASQPRGATVRTSHPERTDTEEHLEGDARLGESPERFDG